MSLNVITLGQTKGENISLLIDRFYSETFKKIVAKMHYFFSKSPKTYQSWTVFGRGGSGAFIALSPVRAQFLCMFLNRP